jgi:hypothetical protein
MKQKLHLNGLNQNYIRSTTCALVYILNTKYLRNSFSNLEFIMRRDEHKNEANAYKKKQNKIKTGVDSV